jgi:hypothetical protein
MQENLHKKRESKEAYGTVRGMGGGGAGIGGTGGGRGTGGGTGGDNTVASHMSVVNFFFAS